MNSKIWFPTNSLKTIDQHDKKYNELLPTVATTPQVLVMDSFDAIIINRNRYTRFHSFLTCFFLISETDDSLL